jgi:hypothetical protein
MSLAQAAAADARRAAEMQSPVHCLTSCGSFTTDQISANFVRGSVPRIIVFEFAAS